jgi:hypothetical protein
MKTETKSNVRVALWTACFGYLALYVFGLVMGVFSPAELIGFTGLAIMLVGLTIWHGQRERDELAHATPDERAEIMHPMHVARERRGY